MSEETFQISNPFFWLLYFIKEGIMIKMKAVYDSSFDAFHGYETRYGVGKS